MVELKVLLPADYYMIREAIGVLYILALPVLAADWRASYLYIGIFRAGLLFRSLRGARKQFVMPMGCKIPCSLTWLNYVRDRRVL